MAVLGNQQSPAIDKRLGRKLFSRKPLLVSLGFGLGRGWLICFSIIFISFLFPADFRLPAAFLFFSSATLSSLMLALTARMGVGRERMPYFYLVLLVIVIVAVSIQLLGLLTGSLLFGMVAVSASGIVAGLLEPLCAEQMYDFEYEEILFASAGAVIVAAITSLSLLFLPSVLRLVILAILPFVTYFVLNVLQTIEQVSGEPPQTVHPNHALGRLAFLRFLFAILIFCLVCRTFDFFNYELNGLFTRWSLVFQVPTGAVFVIVVYLLGKKLRITSVYKWILPIMATGFTLMGIFPNESKILSLLFIYVGYDIFVIILWTLLVLMAKRHNGNHMRIYGLGAAPIFMGMAMGKLSSNWLTSASLSDASSSSTVVALIGAALLIIIVLLIFPEKKFLELAGEDSVEKKTQVLGIPEKLLEEACKRAADANKLTPRETEVLTLLAQGRTLKVIARTLIVSPGTAGSHIRKIYQKTGIHKQQDLIDYVASLNQTVED
jgi:DNA-binding CsgD family transcriptional regulator